MKVGIVGLGYVGSAILKAYQDKHMDHKIHTFDIDNSKNPSCDSLKELVNNSDLLYICVPTPMTREGKCDVSIVEKVTQEINDITSQQKIIVIKSTVVPTTTQQLQEKYPNHIFLFSPEFLTEKNYIDDYKNQQVMILGICNQDHISFADNVLQEQLSTIDSCGKKIITLSTTAEFYKYVSNTFLATKVSFANEMAQIANNLHVDWDHITNIILYDNRLGNSHWKVPGPDGLHGFGGTCFPKDISALINFANNLNIETPILKTVWERNITIDRPQKDWENMKGRAVV